ncbi:MAG: hypothetical protein GY774_27530 [Planctomycetes bacterium]|nr:hypothetical protein [Planctomycetota bacterium]
MKKSYINIDKTKSREELMPLLEGHVFHVTKARFDHDIENCGKIVPNISGSLESSFGSSRNSYFRNMGCVSVFDFRKINDEEPVKHLHKCAPWSPLSKSEPISIYIFNAAIHDNLISWIGWKSSDLRQMVVPYIEAGHKGPIDLSVVDQIIYVSTECEDKNPFGMDRC